MKLEKDRILYSLNVYKENGTHGYRKQFVVARGPGWGVGGMDESGQKRYKVISLGGVTYHMLTS